MAGAGVRGNGGGAIIALEALPDRRAQVHGVWKEIIQQ
jgi:hypothetical protein